jgi:hypothetical protein
VQKSTPGSYREEQLLAAISAVKSGRSIREVGKAFKIVESTFRLPMKAGITSTAGLGRKAAFAADRKQELAKHILGIAELFS